MAQVYRCDGCREISDGGDDWFEISWSPFRTPVTGNGGYGEPDSIGPSRARKVVCSAECFSAMIRFAMEDISQWSSIILDSLPSLAKKG